MFNNSKLGSDMANIKSLPETGFLGLYDIVSRPAITPEQSAATHRALAEAIASGDQKAIDKARFRVQRPRSATRGLFPISRSTWLTGVRNGKYPKPVKLSTKTTVWRVEDIKKLIENTGQV